MAVLVPSKHTRDSFPSDAIAIVGAACRLPGVDTLEDLWDIISQGRIKFEEVPKDRCRIEGSFRGQQDRKWMNQRKFYGNFVDDVAAFDNAFFGISPREAAYMDPQQRLLLATAFEAMDSSGYLRNHRKEDGDPVGCFIGSTYTEYLENTCAYSPSAFTAPGTIRAFLSGKISYYFGWTGPSEVIDTACSASLVAIHRACRAIQAGDCSMALAGGVNLITGIHNYLDLAKAGFLSPTGQYGYCRADGVGLVVLKSLDQAINSGDQILAVIRASATNQGGLHAPSITVPDSKAQQALYRHVISEAGILPEEVSYIEAHGTGTRVGDPIEIESIRTIFGGSQRTAPLHLGSIKANIGHCETAAGVASLLKVITMFSHRSIPPLAGFRALNPKIASLEPDQIIIPTKLLPWMAENRNACVNSYGASGSNSTLICSEWVGEANIPRGYPISSSVPYPVLLSAASKESLRRYACELASHILKSPPGMSVGDIAYTLSERRKHHQFRWTTTAADLPSLVQQLRSDIRPSEIPKTPRRVVLVFSGQSKLNVGLHPRLRETSPRFMVYIDACSQILINLGYPDIRPALYKSEPIEDVVILQCGTFSVQYASARCWLDGGLKVETVIGHSLGELTALAVSGALSLEDALKLVSYRACLMSSKWGPDRGTMLAIHANLATVRKIIGCVTTATNSSDSEVLEIACYNSMASHVVVGNDSSISVAEMILQSDPQYSGIRAQRLNVSHGFHSRFTEPLLGDLVEFSRKLEFHHPNIPLEMCTEHAASSTTTMGPTYLAHHSRKPVYFVNAVQRLEKKLGNCVWLEAGWQTPITSMTRKAVTHPEAHVFQSAEPVEIAVANLWREGIANSHWAFLTPRESDVRQMWLPPYQFDCSRYWLEYVDRTIEERNKLLPGVDQSPIGAKTATSLVSYRGCAGSNNASHNFRIHTETERFTRIVKGHAVRQRPLCPASMYMECVTMGALILGTELSNKTLSFQNINFYRGLGCEEGINVQLRLDCHVKDSNWNFTVHSTNATYAEGDFQVSLAADPDFNLYSVLVSQQMTALRNNPNTEKLLTCRAYSLFSRVVDYGELLQGITSIVLGENQAVAQINIPSATFTQQESTAADIADARTLDTFIQVLGLLINSSTGLKSESEVYVAAAINRMVILPCDFRTPQTWTVYAMFSATDRKYTSGAIFVFSEAGEMLVLGSGIRFVRIQAARLERMLGGPCPQTTPLVPEVQRCSTDVISNGVNLSAPSVNKHGLDSLQCLKVLVSTYTSVPVNEIDDDESFGSMGLDSLATMELADDLKAKFEIIINADDIAACCVKDLKKHLNILCEKVSNGKTNDHMCNLTSIADQAPLANGRTNGQKKKRTNCQSSRHKIETLMYKKVDGVEIPADIFIPLEAPPRAMPIALMIHGGGHMTLSRKAVRPSQTSFLLTKGILPISIDYRLCPLVNIIDGPMTDVRDAYAWAQQDLPHILRGKVEVDPTKIVVIGWSTGGHLAMTTSWTARAAGLTPPLAILSFYCPTNYDPSAQMQMGKQYPRRTMSMSDIRKALPTKPMTSHSFNSTDTSGLGWIQPGDPLSELVLALVKEENGMGLLLDGIPTDGEKIKRPDLKRAAAISPLAQVRAGNYQTPTFLIIGKEDEIVPFQTAVEFTNALKEHGVKSGLLPIPGARHIHDLTLAPGSEGWEMGVEPGYKFLFEQMGWCDDDDE
ncbi:ketoacyl-synt-domain-containing protein [Aspergillus sclerotioniger CBS 115572]|uniref:Ketoacyl-synt-domain-containing protein n=1 Tax=Aspergillus sclerotioniger CBS 115572 TaxID=1450535 RepID=A0A317X5H2_9EURO|nr:ketoacyl-synt-domain-containing protein [Aspergillus sclerotioniger CBS 115572]PWY93856.1 ketoacyl-synt-domain-containing protein [Aspergillus sclerotioniger CBS 115572]